jgi:hypothetical protein
MTHSFYGKEIKKLLSFVTEPLRTGPEARPPRVIPDKSPGLCRDIRTGRYESDRRHQDGQDPMSDITRHPRPDGQSATQHLDAAAALIRAGYCLEANAQDANRRMCPVMAPEAVAWSLYGALLRATGGDEYGGVARPHGVSPP